MSWRGPLGADGRSVTFASLSNPNYRLYFMGQAISVIGTWMQMTAQAWLVVSITGSATALGLVIALQTLPVLLLGPYGGVIADRVDKRRLMVILQSAMGVQALVMGLLTVTGHVQYWELCALAALLGLNNAFENPARQSFVLEMVGPEHLRNAVSLNTLLVNVARAVGPAVAGLLIASVGEGWCFLLNAVSFAGVVTSLQLLDRSRLSPSTPLVRGRGQLREGLSYVGHTPQLGIPLLMMVVTGIFAYEFQVTLPLFAHTSLHAGPEGFGFLTAAMGVGAVAGALRVATSGTTGIRPLTRAAFGFGVAILLTALAPSLPLALLTMAMAGWMSVTYMTTGNTTLQLGADPTMRGRVMSLWFVAFQGTTPIGGPLLGWIIAASNPRLGLGLGAVACFAVTLLGVVASRRLVRGEALEQSVPAVAAVAESEVPVPVTARAPDALPDAVDGDRRGGPGRHPPALLGSRS